MEKLLGGKRIILGVTGSIAAYKAADLTSKLCKLGAEVTPVMTEAAQKFITPLTLQTLARQAVATDLWDDNNGWRPGHIELAEKADLLLVAPATADVLAQFALGLAPDLLSSLFLMARCPVLIAPAMNGAMWTHPATAANVATLKKRGAEFIGPEKGMLACGYEGIGRLWPVEGIIDRAIDILVRRKQTVARGGT
jgi:phosphopantothenoylcysteine decarboxylase/phosphopantothenate--cysteine ligase